MHPSRVLITAAFVLTGMSSVMAASSVDLVVKGVITPAACTPSLSASGIVDYGKISAQDLKPYVQIPLPDKALNLAVNCSATALVVMKVTDNRVGTALHPYATYPELSSFGMGLASNGNKIGRYILKLNKPMADGAAIQLIESVNGETWFYAQNTVWQPNWLRAVNVDTGGYVPRPLQDFEAELVISAVIAGQQTLPITEDIQLDGSATVDIVYL